MTMNHSIVRRAAGPVAALLMLAVSVAPGQIAKVLAFDIKEQIQLGKASVTVVPSVGADSTKVFDGNSLTEYAQGASDSLVLHPCLRLPRDDREEQGVPLE